jgi:hypothetical protein
MGHRSIVPVLAGMLFAAAAHADLKLIPRVSDYESDGVKIKLLVFTDGDKEVTYQSPRGWDYSGSATQLILHPVNKSQAEGTITRISLTESGNFDDESLKTLVAQATAALPQGSEKITLVSQEKNPLRINRRETFLLVFAYTLFGQPYNRSILFLNREKEQIRFQLVCREADFKELQKAFLGSQYSWQNL